MTPHEYNTITRKLRNLDYDQINDIICDLKYRSNWENEWVKFRDNPSKYLLSLDDSFCDRIFAKFQKKDGN